MNGKIKTKFAALFAVALMITVCVVPVVGNEGTDAAPVSSTNGEVFEGYDITLYKEGGDYSGLVYHGILPAGFSENDWTCMDDVSPGNGYWVSNATGKYLLAEDIPEYVVTPDTYGMPMIQFVFGYDQVNVNSIDFSITVGNDTNENLITYSAPAYAPTSDKNQGIVTIALGTPASGYTVGVDAIGLDEYDQVGDFDVKVVATQGITQQIINKTVNAGAAITVSGIVKDAGKMPIKGATVTLDDARSVITKADGKYSFNVEANTVVSATVSYVGGDYTFDASKSTYSFGTVVSSETHDFEAKEKTGKVTINDANGKVVSPNSAGAPYGGISVSFKWYSQTSATADNVTTYTISDAATGSAELIEIVDGIAYFSYTNPTAVNGTTFQLIATATGSGAYTFADAPSITTGTKNITSLISGNNAVADVTGGNGTVKAVEKTGVITILDSGSYPSIGATATITWYSQVASTTGTPTTYTVSALSTVTTILSNADGIVTYTYQTPAPADNTTYFLLAAATGGINTYDSIPTSWDNTKTLSSQITGLKIGNATQNGNATINGKNATYMISGKFDGYVAEDVISTAASYTVNAGSPISVNLQKDGTYKFYVLLNDVVVISNTIGYLPASVSLGTIENNTTYDFVKPISSVESGTVEYIVNIPSGIDVTFTYSIDGEKNVTTIESDANGAILELTAKIGAQIEVSAVAEGYNVPAFVGYSADAKLIYTKTYKVTDGDNAIPGATFGVTYLVGGVTKIKQLKADENGYATFSDVYAPLSIMKDGTIITAVSSEQWTIDEEGNEITYYEVDLGSYYEIGMATMMVMYAVAYNSDTVTSEPVGVAPISGTMTATNNVVVGNEYALKAPSIDNFEFVAWMVDGVVVSESADYTFKADKVDTTYEVVALYSAVHYEEPAEGLSMNVLVIGIVILILGILAVAYGIISKKQ